MRFLGLNLAQAPPGPYELVLTVKDEVARDHRRGAPALRPGGDASSGGDSVIPLDRTPASLRRLAAASLAAFLSCLPPYVPGQEPAAQGPTVFSSDTGSWSCST